MSRLSGAERQARWRKRNKQRIRAYAKDWHRREAWRHRQEVKDWRSRNRARHLLQQAKLLLSRSTGLHYRNVPEDLAEAKALQLEIARWVREVEALSQ
jgi:hypothetical protein